MSAYVWPCVGGYVSSKFGPRKAPKKGASTYHNGIDIAASAGTAILSAKPGKVIFVGYNSARGNYLKIDHSGGVVTLYQHCQKILVSTGTKVNANQKIALVGSTGISTGPHLHFEVQINGTPKNPLNYVSPGNTKYTGSSYGGAADSKHSAVGKSNNGTTAGNSEVATKEITTVVTKSISGSPVAQKIILKNLPSYLNDGVEILIQNDQVYLPVIEGTVTLEISRKGSPAKLTFTVLKDELLNFQEGNPVTFRFNGIPVFAGFVFKKRRSNSVQIDVTAYDQLRYLKNEDTLSYTNKTYTEVLKMVAADYKLQVGDVSDTKYKIPSRIEEGTIMDALQNASDLTVMNTGILYVLYDDFGKIALQPIQKLILPIVVDADTASGYLYESGIDKNTYDKIKLAVDNDQTGEREVYILNEPTSQSKWGQLQYYEKVDGSLGRSALSERAKILLNYYNKKQRSLTINAVLGDVRVRGGSLLVVNMNLGDIGVKNYMLVEKVVHKFSSGFHTMDITLSGIRGEFTS